MLFVREVILGDVRNVSSAIISSPKCPTVYKSKGKLMVTLTICSATHMVNEQVAAPRFVVD